MNSVPHTWRFRTLLTALTINAAIWAARFLWASRTAYPIAWLTGLAATGIAVALTSAGIVLVHLIVGRRHIHPAWRYSSYVLPSAILMLISVVASRPPPNQTQNLISPSGSYVLSVPIEHDRWRVTIRGSQGNVEYVDRDSEFVGWLSVYWIWDEHDRAWLYNSDDGRVYCWVKEPGGWRKTSLGRGEGLHYSPSLDPPNDLFPDYAKRKQKRRE